jgi:hypothetical protein
MKSQTKDILQVQKLFRHKNIRNTLIYITIEKTYTENKASMNFTSKWLRTSGEAIKLIEVGFEYVCTHDKIMLFRKPK